MFESLNVNPTLIFIAIAAFILIGVLLSIMILVTKSYLVSTAPCKIMINDDPSLTKETNGGSTLLAALSAQNIAIPSPCGGKATCKQCKVQVLKGGGEPLETDKGTFSPKELKCGWRLSCQCKVKEDIAIKLPENLLELKMINAKVLSNKNVATFIKELVVEVEEGAILYQPGDYLQFHVSPFKTNTSDWKDSMDEKFYEDWERFHLFDNQIDFSEMSEDVIRAYSMASYPGEGNILKFNIRIASPPMQDGKPKKGIPWGICSSYTFGLKPGDKLRLSGPFGESHMKDDDRELVFLIGGAGSSFGRSHVMDLFKTRKTKRKVSYWYGARSLKENIYQEDLESIEKEFKNFSYHLVLSEPTEEDIKKGWPKNDPIKTAFLFKAFEQGQLKNMEEPENCLYYVCGPPLHNQSVMKLLDNYGVSKENIVLDDFGS